VGVGCANTGASNCRVTGDTRPPGAGCGARGLLDFLAMLTSLVTAARTRKGREKSYCNNAVSIN